MSFWSNNPELYDEIIYKQMFAEGLVTVSYDEADPEDAYQAVVKLMLTKDGWKVAVRAEKEFWASKTDDVMNQMKEKKGEII